LTRNEKIKSIYNKKNSEISYMCLNNVSYESLSNQRKLHVLQLIPCIGLGLVGPFTKTLVRTVGLNPHFQTGMAHLLETFPPKK